MSVYVDNCDRRHSFHDLYSFRDLRVLRPEWMRIDVDLCGHLLIMHRREELLRDMIGCAAVSDEPLNSCSFTDRV